MQEKLIDIILKIFARVVREGGGDKKEIELVKGFLQEQFAESVAKSFFRDFKFYVNSDFEIDIEKLCSEAVEELTYVQRLYILVKLVELIYADKQITDSEYYLVSRVATSLNLPTLYVEDLLEFLKLDGRVPFLSIGKVLYFVDKELTETLLECEVRVPGIRSTLAVMKFPQSEVLILRLIEGRNIELNGTVLKENRLYLLSKGSVLHFPRGETLYFNDILKRFTRHLTEEDRITFVAENISYVFPNGNYGLHPLSLYEENGNMVAIMGASGAGKSTLVNILTGIYKPTTGSVRINGIDVHKEPDKAKGFIGYITQDDLLIEELTVFENLYYNAKLALKDLTEDQIKQKIDNLLEELGLSEIKHLKVGSPLNKLISGGQRKRLNIALELIREPSVLFLDEPTSGLSSADSEMVIDLLKDLVSKGKLIFIVIHQPSSEVFKQFDKLLVLDKGGYPVYYGHPLQGIAYFRKQANYADTKVIECPECGNIKPEEIFNILEAPILDAYGRPTNKRKVEPEEWYQRFKKYIEITPIKEETKLPGTIFRPSPKWKQYLIFFIRDAKRKIANKSYLAITFSEAPLLGLVLAFILRFNLEGKEYHLFDNVNLIVYLFIAVIVALFLGMSISAEEIIKDRKIQKREHFLNLSRNSYLLSKISILFIVSAIQTLLFVLIGHFVIGLRELYFWHWLLLFITAFHANLIGLNISATFDSSVAIYIFIPILLIPQIILSGTMVDFRFMNRSITRQDVTPIIGDLITSRWSYEALAVKQFSENSYMKNFFDVEKDISNATYHLSFFIPEIEKAIASLQISKVPVNPLLPASPSKKLSKEEEEKLLTLIRNSLKEEVERFDNLTIPNLENLYPEKYSVKDLNEILKRLKVLNQYYKKKLAVARNKKAEIVKTLGRKQVDSLRKKYHNERLESIVTNRNFPFKILPYRGKLVQIMDPIYQTFYRKNPLNYRTPMYASVKPFLGKLWGTYGFNIAVLIIFSIILYITLYFELFRKIIEFFTVLWEKRQYKKMQ